MFKRLRERITEEASKSVAQLGNNSTKSLSESDNKGAATNSSEDLITLSESSAVVVPHTSSQQFSIGEDEDGSMSEQSTPQKNVDVSNGSVSYSTPTMKEHPSGADASFSQEYRPKRLSYVPQSDIESEREEPPTLNLESISKEQLLNAIDILKARSCKYKNKYSEVVNHFKEMRDEKLKIEKTLIDTQDKGSRRIAELREQCQLEQKAKAHLEANLRLMLEEKDNRISVLETQINLLKDTGKADDSISLADSSKQSLVHSNDDLLTGDNDSLLNEDSSALQEKIERLEHQFNQAKKTITAQTDQILLLRKQSENLSQELEEKVKKAIDLEDQQVILKSEHEFVLRNMQIRLEELEKQQEESAMAMAETKRNMHEELELKEKQLVKAKKEANQCQSSVECEKQKVADLKKLYEDKIIELQRQLESTEKTLEDEKQNLMQELARGKTAAITLMQKDCAQKISAVEEEWKAKLQDLKSENSKIESEGKSLSEMKEKLKQSKTHVQELNSLVIELEKENESLRNKAEKIKSVTSESEQKMKFENYVTNFNEVTEQTTLNLQKLENEKLVLEEDNLKLLKEKDKLSDEKLLLTRERNELQKDHIEKVKKLQEKLKDKENLILKLESELESLAKESSEKIESFKIKVKVLEEEEEQLMHEAQERVSATEAKCREDINLLQEENNKLSIENQEVEQLRAKICLLERQMQENLHNFESSTAEFSDKILHLEEQLSEAKEELQKLQAEKQATINKLSEQLQKFKEESSQLVTKSVHLEDLKSEKEALNEKLRHAELQVLSIKKLETERDNLKSENTSILEELHSLKSSQNSCESLTLKTKNLEETVVNCMNAHKQLETENETLKMEISSLKDSFDNEVSSLKSRNENLSKQIDLLEKIDPSDLSSASVKNYIASVRQECERAVKTKEEDMESKLKLLVCDFSEQMDIKDRDCDKITNEILERNQDLEDRLTIEYKNEIVELRQNLFEKECALDDIRDDYEERIQEKDKKIKEYELLLIKNSPHSGNGVSSDSTLLTTESSDWDDTWAVPDEAIDNTTSPALSNAVSEEHVKQIETLKEELSKSNSEIKELKVLLRLSPPESMVNINNRRDSLQSIPEPTEFEYLKNIIYEYMMGKEPATLAKVIAAVLRFSEVQTQQVIRKEESRHQTK